MISLLYGTLLSCFFEKLRVFLKSNSNSSACNIKMSKDAPNVEMMESSAPSVPVPSTPVCEHPAERLVRQKRKLKGTDCCCGCCYTTEMIHKCMRCGKVAAPPKVLLPGSTEYRVVQDAYSAKKSKKTLTGPQTAALSGIVVGAAGCIMLYGAWNSDTVNRFEPIHNRGGGGCAAACGGGVG